MGLVSHVISFGHEKNIKRSMFNWTTLIIGKDKNYTQREGWGEWRKQILSEVKYLKVSIPYEIGFLRTYTVMPQFSGISLHLIFNFS